MKKLSARRRHPLAALAVLLLALATTGGLYAAFAPAGSASADASSSGSSLQIKQGKVLFATGCSSCHGLHGQGTANGPSLIGVGAAAVDFQVGTGRMPAQGTGAQIPSKKTIYNESDTRKLAAYVSSLGPGGASIPTSSQVDPANANLSKGGELFRTNCSQCHNFAGKGGALSQGKYAPALTGVSPKHLYEAMETGPQNMPNFPDSILPAAQKRDIIKYVTTAASDSNPDAGGFTLGSIGPVSEGLFGWIFGLGALIAIAIWIAARTTKAKKS